MDHRSIDTSISLVWRVTRNISIKQPKANSSTYTHTHIYMYIIMKFTVIVPLILAGSIDAFSTSSMTRRSAAVASSTLYAASQLPMPKRSPTANPTIRDASKSVPVKVVTQRERNMMKDVVIDPDYWLSLNVALLCPLILWYHPCKSYSVYIKCVCVCRYYVVLNSD